MVAAEVIPGPRIGEAWGLTLHPLQHSGPKCVQRTGMLEPRSQQLDGHVASGCLPGSSFPFNTSNLQRLFQIPSCSNLASNFTKDTSVFFYPLKVLLPQAGSLPCPALTGNMDLDGPCFLDSVTVFLIYLSNKYLSAYYV